jgi:hypothetical protein
MKQPKKPKAIKNSSRSAAAAPPARSSRVRAPRVRMAAAEGDERSSGNATPKARRAKPKAKARSAPARPAVGKKDAPGAGKRSASVKKVGLATARTAQRADAPKPAVGRAARATSEASTVPASRTRPKPVAAIATQAESPAAVEQPRGEAMKYGVSTEAFPRFEEERFLFPRSYEVNRIRVVVRDPEWLFAYWDVNPRAFEAIRRELGERVVALSRLTLKIVDPDSSASEVVLLPYGARSWYARIDAARYHVVAELGITLPSGQFRSLARSNTVLIPRRGPSAQGATRSVSYGEAWAASGPLATGFEGEYGPGLASRAEWGSSIRGGASDRLSSELQQRLAADAAGLGASDVFRP